MRHNVIEYAPIDELPSMRPNRWDGRGVKAVLREATDAGRWGCAREQRSRGAPLRAHDQQDPALIQHSAPFQARPGLLQLPPPPPPPPSRRPRRHRRVRRHRGSPPPPQRRRAAAAVATATPAASPRSTSAMTRSTSPRAPLSAAPTTQTGRRRRAAADAAAGAAARLGARPCYVLARLEPTTAPEPSSIGIGALSPNSSAPRAPQPPPSLATSGSSTASGSAASCPQPPRD